jgi:uncharacterized protein (TIGR02145 family)
MRSKVKNEIKNWIYQLIIIWLVLILTSYCKRVDNNTVKDIDGNVYKTIVIGKYRWMGENLKTTAYNNGTKIPNITEQSAWISLNIGAYCWYNNNKSYSDTFGLLYNWHAVSTGNLCPDGWRVPSDKEWKYLEGYVDTRYGVGDSVWDKPGLRGQDAGQRLRTNSGWRSGITGTDNFGFSALPGGEHLSRFYAGGSSGFWWSSNEASASSAWYRSLIYSYEFVARDTHPKRMGFSIRCIKNN